MVINIIKGTVLSFRANISVVVIVAVLACLRYLHRHQMQPPDIKTDDSRRDVDYTESHEPIIAENTDWRKKELDRLSEIVQRRLFYIQNPKNCETAKKVLCKFKGGDVGYGAGMLDLIFCLIVAYATQRTLIFDSSDWAYSSGGLNSMFLPLSTNCMTITNQTPTFTDDLQNIENIQVVQLPRNSYFDKRPIYLPLSIPADLGDDLIRVHQNPAGWWMGQFLIFATKYKPDEKQYIEESINKLGFMNPIVGVHVRGDSKKFEANLHDIDDYMEHAERWFERYEMDIGPVQRRVFLATDDLPVIEAAKQRYPRYTFVTNLEASSVAKRRITKYTENGLHGALLDIEILSRCDFFVGTLSSNFARMVYYLMHTRSWDAPSRIRTLDVEFTFHCRFLKSSILLERYMDTLLKDNVRRIRVFRNTSKITQATLVSLDNEQLMVEMPTYPEVPEA